MEVGEYRYAGPDGEGIANLPEGVGAAIGSEYCIHLVPGTEKLAAAVSATRERKVPMLLLTPYFRDDELKRAMPLFRSIPSGADVDVAVNDWGVLFTLHTLFPGLHLSLGRLLSGQKRCPRIGSSLHLTEEGRAWHGEGVFSSAAARNFLAREFGVSGYHVDSLEWGSTALEKIPADGSSGGTRLYVHEPFAAVTVSDRCPWIGGKSSSEVSSCDRPCGDGAVILLEPSMGGDMIQRGKGRFVRRVPSGLAARDTETVCNRVIYDDPP